MRQCSYRGIMPSYPLGLGELRNLYLGFFNVFLSTKYMGVQHDVAGRFPYKIFVYLHAYLTEYVFDHRCVDTRHFGKNDAHDPVIFVPSQDICFPCTGNKNFFYFFDRVIVMFVGF